MPRALIVSIFADAKQFTAELDKAAGKTKAWGKAAGVAGLAIAGGLAYGMEKSVKLAQEGQVSQARLGNAFANSGNNVNKWTGQIGKAEQAGNNLGFTNIDVRDSLGSLEIATHKPAMAIKDLGVAEDIARFKHIGLTDASKMLTMAMAGSTRAVKQLGLTIPPVTSATDKAKASYTLAKNALTAQLGSTSKMTAAEKVHAQALQAALKTKYDAITATAKLTDKQQTASNVIAMVSQKLHGQASAFAATAQGGAARLHAQLTSLGESFGNVILPAFAKFIGVLANAAGWLSRHGTAAKVLVGVLATLAATMITVSVATKIGSTYTTIAAAAQKLFAASTEETTAATEGQTAAQWLLNAALDANPIGLIVIALAALGAAFYIAWEKSATFRRIVTGVFNAIKGAAMTVINWVKGHWPMIVTFLSGPFFPIVALATNAFGVRSALLGAFHDMWNFAKGLWNDLGNVWDSAWAGAWGLVKGQLNMMIGGINALIGAWDSLKFSFGGFNHFGVHIGGFSIGVPQIPKIPLLAAGALVSKPTFAMLGESGPELVLPLSRPARMAALMERAFGGSLLGGSGGSRRTAVTSSGGGFAMVAEVPINISLADGRVMRETRKITLRAERRGARDLHLGKRHET